MSRSEPREDRADRAAALLHEAQRSRRALTALPADCRPTTLDEAYAVQARFIARLGTPVGYKIGYTNPAIQERFGLDHPISGRLLAGRILESPAELPADCLRMYAAEPEFAFRMREALPLDEAPFVRERVAPAIESVIPALEIVESRIEDWEKMGPLQTVADNTLGGHWVGGRPTREWSPEVLEDQEIVASVNGAEVTRGHGRNVIGGPLGALVWLANHLAERGAALAAGDLVTTGCCTAVIEARPGDEIRADFGRFGEVQLRFVS